MKSKKININKEVFPKICSTCKQMKCSSDFYKDSNNSSGLRSNCKVCQNISRDLWVQSNQGRLAELRKVYLQNPQVKLRRAELSRKWNRDNPEKVLLTKAKRRAKQLKMPCTITLSDIQIPEKCPALGIQLQINDGKASDNSPTIDRLNSSLGYIPGNIHVISHKANRIKNNSSFEEFRNIYFWWSTLNE